MPTLSEPEETTSWVLPLRSRTVRRCPNAAVSLKCRQLNLAHGSDTRSASNYGYEGGSDTLHCRLPRASQLRSVLVIH
jgi:hypothetical protein